MSNYRELYEDLHGRISGGKKRKAGDVPVGPAPGPAPSKPGKKGKPAPPTAADFANASAQRQYLQRNFGGKWHTMKGSHENPVRATALDFGSAQSQREYLRKNFGGRWRAARRKNFFDRMEPFIMKYGAPVARVLNPLGLVGATLPGLGKSSAAEDIVRDVLYTAIPLGGAGLAARGARSLFRGGRYVYDVARSGRAIRRAAAGINAARAGIRGAFEAGGRGVSGIVGRAGRSVRGGYGQLYKRGATFGRKVRRSLARQLKRFKRWPSDWNRIVNRFGRYFRGGYVHLQ